MGRTSITMSAILLFAIACSGYELISNRTVVRNDTIFSSRGLILKSGPYMLESDSAFMLRNDSLLYIPVPFTMISSDTVSISGFSGVYMTSRGIFDILGNESYINDMDITSDNAVFSTKDSVHSFTGNVHIMQSDSTVILCEHIIIDIPHNKESAEGDFQYTSSDSSLQINADYYTRDKQDSLIIFSGNSRILSNDTEIGSDSFSMDMRTDILFTPLTCSIVYSDYTISGDSLYAYFRNDTIDSAAVLSHITLLEENDERSNAFECKYMKMEFTEGELEQIYFTGIFNAVLTLKEKTNDTESE